MKKFNKWLIDVDEEKLPKRTAFWNLIASMLSALISAILLFCITRINGLNQAGIFTIASAFTYQSMSLGGFGVRNYQASDVKHDYSYWDYFYLRIISFVLMYSLLIYYAFGNGYTMEKSLIILTFGIFKSIDTMEDLIHGELQRYNRLDIGSILQSIRFVLSIGFYIIVLLITKNIIITCILSTIFTLFVLLKLNRPILKKYVKEKKKLYIQKVKNLFFVCLPICIGNAINMYIVNCPKYAIDNVLTNKAQSYYGILSIPVFTINLLSTVIYRVYVKTLGDEWQGNNYKQFFKIIMKQIAVISGLTMSISLFGYVIGLTIIEFIYGVQLHQYMHIFILLLIGGGINSLSGYFAVVLTVQRSQHKLFIGYLTTFIFAFFFADMFIKQWHLLGAAILYCTVNLICSTLFIIFIIINYMQKKRIRKN